MLTLATFLLVSAPCSSAVDTLATPAVIGIYARHRGGASWGTGFFIADDGLAATAYHVIKGAKDLKVYFGGHSYPASIVATAPRVDMAVLRVTLLPGKVPCLPLRPDSIWRPQAAVPLDAWKRASQRRAYVNLDTRGWRTAQSVEDIDLEDHEFFVEPEMRLVTFEGHIYRGFSGAPLVMNGAAVGVVSGAIEEREAYTLSWAISVIHLLPLVPAVYAVGAFANEFTEWSPVTLVADERSWNNLTASVVESDIRDTPLSRVPRVLGIYDALTRPARDRFQPYADALAQMAAACEAMIALGEKGSLGYDPTAILNYRNTVGSMAVLQLNAAQNAAHWYADSLSSWHDSVGALSIALSNYVDSLLSNRVWSGRDSIEVVTVRKRYKENDDERSDLYARLTEIYDEKSKLTQPFVILRNGNPDEVLRTVRLARRWLELEQERLRIVTGETYRRNARDGLLLLLSLQEYTEFRSLPGN